MKKTLMYCTLVMVITMFGTTSFAGQQDAIDRCKKALKIWADGMVPNGEVTYKKGSWIEWDKVWWDGITCETGKTFGIEMVRSLKINGEHVIFEFFAGEEGKKLFDNLDNDIEKAIAVLESRITILNEIRSEAEDQLKKPQPNLEQIASTVATNIRTQLGNQYLMSEITCDWSETLDRVIRGDKFSDKTINCNNTCHKHGAKRS